jgi:hypothetical protein
MAMDWCNIMVADYHIHTRASPDAEGSLADVARLQREEGLMR